MNNNNINKIAADLVNELDEEQGTEETKNKPKSKRELRQNKPNFFTINRDIWDSSVNSDPVIFRLYIMCISRANFDEKSVIFGGEYIKLKRGQFITSWANLTKEYNKGVKKGVLTQKKLKCRINRLIDSGKIEWKGQSRFSLITVVNYDFWQSSGQSKSVKTKKGKAKKIVNNANTSTGNTIKSLILGDKKRAKQNEGSVLSNVSTGEQKKGLVLDNKKRAKQNGEKRAKQNNTNISDRIAINKNKGQGQKEEKGFSEGFQRSTVNNYNNYNNKKLNKKGNYKIEKYLNSGELKNIEIMEEFQLEFLKSVSNFERVLVSLDVFLGNVWESEESGKRRLALDRASYVHELDVIARLSDDKYLTIMRNLQANNRLTLPNLASAISSMNQRKSSAIAPNQIGVDKLRRELAQKMGL